MPRSSRSKSHKQSKHSTKDSRDYITDSEEDVRMKDRNGKEESSSVRVSKDSVSGEKRKLSSQLRDGATKDLSSHGNGDAAEEYSGSKRRKEKSHGGSDRWNGGGDEKTEVIIVEKDSKGEIAEKVSKSKDSSKVVGESKSKSSRRHDSGSEKKEEGANVTAEKEESKSGGIKGESKRKSEKESGRKEGHKDSKESKDKERGSDRERKVQDIKRDVSGAKTVDGEDQQSKRGRENTEWAMEEDLRNPELEKELEKRIKRRGESSSEKDKYQDDVKESEDRRLSTRGDRSKDLRQKDERHKDESYGDKYREDGDREGRHREDKYRDDGEKDNRHRDAKYREDGERENRHKDEKYREDGDRDNRHRDDKYHEDSSRDNRYKEDKYRDDGDRDGRRRDDKHREGGDRDDRNRDDRNRDDKHRQDGDRDYKHKEEKHREDVDRDSRHRDGRSRDDTDREKRVRDAKYRDIHTSRDRPSESETKRVRDDSSAADLYYRKSGNRDASPTYDDRVTRYKDDKDRRRGNDKEEPSDSRSRGAKEHRSDAEKRSMSSAKVDAVADRGRPNSRNADLDININHSRRRISPNSSSYAGRDHYRVSKQEESKYRDYAYEERVRPNVTSNRDFATGPGQSEKISSSRSLEKIIQKDDSHLGELSAERRLRSDVRGSPLQLVDKSPSSTSNDRRHLNRSDVRRSLDVEESGQRSGGSKDAKDYSGKERRESRDLPMETYAVDELSQADGDNLSVSSPYTRNSHFSGNSKSLLPPPPPPFRSGADSPSLFGTSEDDNRGKTNNRHRRMGDSNMGRVQGGWKGVPNWQSPLANGYIPFQHGPPPVGFHPVIQQFPPPMFGVRPPMKLNQLNHTGVPYHIPDGDRFSSHGRPHGWRNPVDDSIPPPLHGWDTNNGVYGDKSHMYGRLDWDRGRTPLSNRGWETSSDPWKGQNIGASLDLPSATQKEDYSARRQADEVWSGQSSQPVESEQNQFDLQAEGINISQPSDSLERNTPEAPKISYQSPHISETSKEDDASLSQVYLLKVDVSADLTQPELYDQCMSMIDFDPSMIADEFDRKILIMEDAVEGKEMIPSASLFSAINDSVFEKAMSLYKRQKEESTTVNEEKAPLPSANGFNFVQTSDHEKAGSDDGNPWEEVEEKGELPVSCIQKLDMLPVAIAQNLDEALVSDYVEKPEEQIPSVKVEMDIDPVPNQEEPKPVVEEKPSALENMEQSGSHSPCNGEEVNESNKLVDNEREGPSPPLFNDVSTTEACEAVMPESIESGSVNLSRIHHSPESTH